MKKPSVIKQQQEAVFRLEKSGMETNRSVANLGKSISGVKITTDAYLDKNVLKNLVAKKREPMFPDKQEAKKKKMLLMVQDEESGKVKAADQFVEIKNKGLKLDNPIVKQDERSDEGSPSARKGTYSYNMK